jgi:hypothetical protein
MRIIRVLSPQEINLFQPLFSTQVDGGFIRLKGSGRQLLNPSTGELVSRRQYDETYGTARGTTFEKKRDVRRQQGIGKPNPRIRTRRTFTVIGREHIEVRIGKKPTDLLTESNTLSERFHIVLNALRARFPNDINPTIYIRLLGTIPTEGKKRETREYQTRSIGGFNNASLPILLDDIVKIVDQYQLIITDSLMVWVHDAKP